MEDQSRLDGVGTPAGGGSALEGVLSGGVARLVVKNALASIPDSLDFRKQVLEVLESVAFPGVESIAEEVYADIEVMCCSVLHRLLPLPSILQQLRYHMLQLELWVCVTARCTWQMVSPAPLWNY